MVKYNSNIENRILSYLDGWVVEELDDEDMSNLFIDEVKVIPSEEIEEFFNKACIKISTYLYVDSIPFDERIIEEVCQYTAGLLFKKYTLTPNDNYEDGTNNLGYGNYLLKNALNNLIPFRNSIVSMWALR